MSKELFFRLLWIVAAIAFYRFGSHVPVYGVDHKLMSEFFASSTNEMLSVYNLLSGGSISRMSVLSLGITPFITASIFVQIATLVSPKWKGIKESGPTGIRMLNLRIRLITLMISVFMSVSLLIYLKGQTFNSKAFITDTSWLIMVAATCCLMSGSFILLWLSEKLTVHGLGNGMSMLIVCAIISSLPQVGASMFLGYSQGLMNNLDLSLVAGVIIGLFFISLVVERTRRHLPLTYVTRDSKDRDSTLPFKANACGIMPPVFANMLLLFPVSLVPLLSTVTDSEYLTTITVSLSPDNHWFMALILCTTFIFSILYVFVVIRPKETALKLESNSAMIGTLLPGLETEMYLKRVSLSMGAIAGVYLVLMTLIPYMLGIYLDQQLGFLGTTILILVSVSVDFKKNLDTQLSKVRYKNAATAINEKFQ
ncbi:preprotein translocase subunit SecY [Photobacterium leiognathi]|uniref:preprotein translocase subunit SecY n=1 Tax=Photobacterium leiognathi TaxID=553611 RepID=UPI0029813ADC|nr:preprotein translocase subunit SecY [Photobacterium leiognathi]